MILRAGLLWTRNVADPGARGYRQMGDPLKFRSHGLSLRLRAPDGFSAGAWLDGSGAGNDHIQASGPAQPTLVNNVYNGRPTVRSVAASSQTLTNANFTVGTGPYSFFAAWKNTTGSAACFACNAGNLSLGTLNNTGTDRNIHHGGVSAHGDGLVMSAALEIWCVRYAAGSGPTLLLNGANDPLSAPGVSGLLGGTSSSIASRAGAAFADMDCSELVGFTGAVPDEGARRINKYMGAMYAVAVQ